MRDESVLCLICSYSASDSTQKITYDKSICYFNFLFNSLYCKNSYFSNCYFITIFRIKWHGVLCFNRNKKRKVCIYK